MKGFTHTGNGPKAGHSFSTKDGFTGSACGGPMHKAVGGLIEQHKAPSSGHAAIPRGNPGITEQLTEHGGRSNVLDGYARGGLHAVEVKHCVEKKKGGRIVEFKSGGRVVRFRAGGRVTRPKYAGGGRVTRPKFSHGGHIQDHTSPGRETEGGGDYSRGGRPTGFKKGGKHWIKGAIKHPGALHRALHVPEGQKIPHSKIVKAEHSDNPTTARRAHLAETLGHMHHGRR